MAEGKRHKVRLDFVVEDGDGVETLGANLRFGAVKQEHLLIYEQVIDKHINAAKEELAVLQKKGAFA